MNSKDDREFAQEALASVGHPETPELIDAIVFLLTTQREWILRTFVDLASVIDRKAAEVEGRPVDQAKAYRLHARALRAAVEELEK